MAARYSILHSADISTVRSWKGPTSRHADVHKGNHTDILSCASRMGTRKLPPGRQQRRDESVARLIRQSHSSGDIPVRHARRMRRQQQCAKRQFHVRVDNRASDFSSDTIVCCYPEHVNRPAPTAMGGLCTAALFRHVAATRDSYSGLTGGTRVHPERSKRISHKPCCRLPGRDRPSGGSPISPAAIGIGRGLHWDKTSRSAPDFRYGASMNRGA
jgi:hypothetical protein